VGLAGLTGAGVDVETETLMQGLAKTNVATPAASAMPRTQRAMVTLVVSNVFADTVSANQPAVSAASFVHYAATSRRPMRKQKPIQKPADPS
jgi:hypothetical protein